MGFFTNPRKAVAASLRGIDHGQRKVVQNVVKAATEIIKAPENLVRHNGPIDKLGKDIDHDVIRPLGDGLEGLVRHNGVADKWLKKIDPFKSDKLIHISSGPTLAERIESLERTLDAIELEIRERIDQLTSAQAERESLEAANAQLERSNAAISRFNDKITTEITKLKELTTNSTALVQNYKDSVKIIVDGYYELLEHFPSDAQNKLFYSMLNKILSHGVDGNLGDTDLPEANGASASASASAADASSAERPSAEAEATVETGSNFSYLTLLELLFESDKFPKLDLEYAPEGAEETIFNLIFNTKFEPCIRKILETANNPNALDKHLKAPVHYLASEPLDLDGISVLDFNTIGNGLNPLMIASSRGYIEYAKHLVEKRFVDVHQTNSAGYAALHYASTAEMAKYLVEEKGANVNATTEDGRTPLMSLTLCGCVDSVKYLIEKGANILEEDTSGLTAVEYARRSSNDELKGFFYSYLSSKPEFADAFGQFQEPYIAEGSIPAPIDGFDIDAASAHEGVPMTGEA
jgi:ankyrin repeat protein/vacuolar-type H+-ATPase subunit E/Vma4